LFCRQCGKEFVSAEDVFCRYCGAPKLGAAISATSNLAAPSPMIPDEFKQAAGQISGRLKQISISSVAHKLPLKERVTEKKFMQLLDSKRLAESLEKDFQPLGFALKTTGEERDLYVEFTKSKLGNPLTGYYDPVIVRIKGEEDATLVTIGRAKWTDKALIQKVSSGVFLPVTFTLSSGLVEDKLLGMIWRAVDSYVTSLGRPVEEIVMEGHGRAIEPKLFGGRRAELATFNSRLQSTIDGRARNIAITGQAGIGKSSLLRKFEEISKEKRCLTIRRELDPTITNTKELANYLLEAFKAEAYSHLSKKTEAWDKTKDFFRRRSFSVTGPGIGSFSVGAPSEAATYVLQESFYKESMRLWSQLASNGVRAIVFLLDEAAQIQRVEGGWSFIKSAFTRITESGGRFMLAVAGDIDPTKDGGSSSTRADLLSASPIERFLQPISVGEMSLIEIEEVLQKTVRTKEEPFSPDVSRLIFELSGGNPYLAQNILLAGISHKGEEEVVTSESIEAAIKKTSNLEEIFSERLDTVSSEERKILLALSSFSEPVSQKKLQSRLKAAEIRFDSTDFERLTHTGLVRSSSDGKLSIFSPLFQSYLRSLIEEDVPRKVRPKAVRKKSKKKATPK